MTEPRTGPHCTCPTGWRHADSCALFDVRAAYRQGAEDAAPTLRPPTDDVASDAGHEDEYDALARRLHESIAAGQSVALTAKALRILAPPESTAGPREGAAAPSDAGLRKAASLAMRALERVLFHDEAVSHKAEIDEAYDALRAVLARQGTK